jgi:hypothetical protein
MIDSTITDAETIKMIRYSECENKVFGVKHLKRVTGFRLRYSGVIHCGRLVLGVSFALLA